MLKTKLKNIEYPFFSTDTFTKLAEERAKPCISIYIPTYRSGMKVDEGRIRLKNALQTTEVDLQAYGLNKPAAEAMLKSASELLEDKHFWRSQSDGLALFITRDEMRYFSLPVHCRQQIYISDHFYLRPVLPLLNGDGLFYLLTISRNKVRFYEGARHSIMEIMVDDLVPQGINAKEREENLQYHSVGNGGGNAIYHGHGSGKDDHEVVLRQYLTQIDQGINKLISSRQIPLVLAGTTENLAIYQEVTQYPNVLDQHIVGNPEHESTLLLQEKAWELVEPHYKKEEQNLTNSAKAQAGSPTVSTDMKEILTAVTAGRVKSLFIRDGAQTWGNFDPTTHEVSIQHEKTPKNSSLLNLSAVQTVLQQGKVFELPAGEMPIPDSEVVALFRY